MLKGEKVILRPIERDDLQRLHELHGNVELEIQGGGDWEPFSFARREKWYERSLEDDSPARFVIEADGKIIGDMGLHHRNERSRVTSFGISIMDPDYLGKGYGRDAI